MALRAETLQDIKADMDMSQGLSDYFHGVAERIQGGEAISWETINEEVQQYALEKFGCEYGVALPSMYDVERPLVLAKGTPLFWRATLGNMSEFGLEVTHKGFTVRNSWSRLADKEVVVVNMLKAPEEAYPDEDWGDMSRHLFTKAHWPTRSVALWQYPSAGRVRMLLKELELRAGSHMTADAELRAMESLKGRVNKTQWGTYVLNGVFGEKSKRSGVHYLFRKGRPTLAIRADDDGSRILAALCVHPHGFYAGSHVGLMVPTDEVIAHLLMMRADERRYWAKCGQWPAHDPRSGL